MILKEIGRKIAQAFRLVKSFGPEPPEPDSLLKANESLAAAGIESSAAATYELRRFAEAPRPEPLSHLANNWRKMHGLPMHRKPASFRRRRKTK